MKSEDSLLQRPLGEIVAEHLRQEIWNKDIQFGERLIEADLADRFDISRSTVREALKILEQEELVISKARKGTFVSTFTKKDLDELKEVRTLVEEASFVKALDYLTEEDYAYLEEIINKMGEKAKSTDWKSLFDLDMEFHHYVVSKCENARIIRIYESIQVQIRVYIGHLDQYYSSPEVFYQEHKDLYDVLLNKDSDLIKKQVNHHIAYVEGSFLQTNE